jgi:hypothetical protein
LASPTTRSARHVATEGALGLGTTLVVAATEALGVEALGVGAAPLLLPHATSAARAAPHNAEASLIRRAEREAAAG